MITGIHLIGEETLRRDAERLEKLRAAERAVVATVADAYGAVTDAEEERKESQEPRGEAAHRNSSRRSRSYRIPRRLFRSPGAIPSR
jgi:hypothetical protein